jgi:hypothetical protein
MVALFAACSSSESAAKKCDPVDCPLVKCPCVDGTTDLYGQTCNGVGCNTQDLCLTMKGFCGGHGGVVGGPTEQKACKVLEDCPIAFVCPANSHGKYCPLLYACHNGFCLWDDVCKTSGKECY